MRMVHFLAYLVVTLTATLTLAQTPSPPIKAIGVAEALQQVPGDLKTPDRWALVIGAGDFTDGRIPKLPACANDAKALAKSLTNSSAGMFPADHVTLLTNDQVSKENVIDALDNLRRKAGPQVLVVVFYSGHGATDEEGRAYWIMHDTKVDKLRATALPETDISELLGEVKTTRLVTLIDACYSAATANIGQTKSLLDLKAIFPQFNGDGRLAMTASKGDQLSMVITDKADPGFGYSAFAWYVIQGLNGAADADGDGVVTVDELWNYVKDRTAETSRRMGGNQEPQLKGQLGSKFLLSLNLEHLKQRVQETAAAKALREMRLDKLKTFYADEKLTLDQYQLGQRLVQAGAADLDEFDQRRLIEYTSMLTGSLDPSKLQRMLDAIETPEQRAARLARESTALAEAQRQTKINELLAKAKANDSKENGKTALAALDALLKLDPSHGEGQALYAKISAYYGPRKVTNSIGMTLVEIKPGTFTMGSPADEADRFDNETQHQVTISKGFMMQTTPVTQAQYQAVVGNNPSYFKGDNLPVEQVSWDDAVAYCQKLGAKEGKHYRLPTEAEWEYACRAGTQTAYNTGNDEDALKAAGWYGGNSERTTHAVGTKQANAWGLYDMHGNVFQWCSDWSEEYPKDAVTDPAGAATGTNRVVRGGSWSYQPQFCRSANRDWVAPANRGLHVGFRVVLDFN